MADIKCVRNRKYGTLSINQGGWTKEVCNVTWNGRSCKLDIREWDNNYEKMSKGVTLSKDEAKKLLRILASIDFETFDEYESQQQRPNFVRSIVINNAAAAENPGNNHVEIINNENERDTPNTEIDPMETADNVEVMNADLQDSAETAEAVF